MTKNHVRSRSCIIKLCFIAYKDEIILLQLFRHCDFNLFIGQVFVNTKKHKLLPLWYFAVWKWIYQIFHAIKIHNFKCIWLMIQVYDYLCSRWKPVYKVGSAINLCILKRYLGLSKCVLCIFLSYLLIPTSPYVGKQRREMKMMLQ